jgi:hypothetical protein
MAVMDLEGCSRRLPCEQNIVPMGSGGAKGPGDRFRSSGVQKAEVDSRYGLGGLQSLAAAGAERCPIGLGGAEGPGALQVLIKTSIFVIDLETVYREMRSVAGDANLGRHGGHPSLGKEVLLLNRKDYLFINTGCEAN